MADTVEQASSVQGRRASARLAHLGVICLALLANVALVDAAVETWQSGSPVRIWVAGPAALYVSFSLWIAQQHSQNRPDAQTSAWLSTYLLLALAAATSTFDGGLDNGIRLATLPTPVVLSLATLAVLSLAIVSLVFRSSLPLAGRAIVFALGVYGIVAFVMGLEAGRTYTEMLQGASFWEDLPYWMRGAFVGALIVVPFAFVVDVGVALARVKIRGLRYRIVAFALGFVMAQAAFTAAQPLKPQNTPNTPNHSTAEHADHTELFNC